MKTPVQTQSASPAQQHTPGPWSVRDTGECFQVFADEFTPIADCFAHADTDDEANARLIAASPNMASCLQELVRLADAGITPKITRGGHREEQDWADNVKAAREILAKLKYNA